MKNQKISKDDWEDLVSAIEIVMIILLFFFAIYTNQSDFKTNITITIEKCLNESYLDFDNPKLLKEISLTQNFDLAGLEEVNIDYIFNYLNKDKFEDLCFDEDWHEDSECKIDSVYRNIYRWNDNLESLKMIYNDFEYQLMTSWNVSGEGIRIDGENIKNLRYDINTIEISFTIQEKEILIKEEEVCELEVVDYIEFKIPNSCAISEYGNVINGGNLNEYETNYYTKNISPKEVCAFANISKEDISIDWFNERCECVEDRKEQIGHYCINEDTLKEINEKDNCWIEKDVGNTCKYYNDKINVEDYIIKCDFGEDDCQNYKCEFEETYYVEVIQ